MRRITAMDQPQKCRAKSKGTGKQCQRFVTPGYNVCYYHGANPGNHGGAPRGNKNALKYGAYVNKLLNEAERSVSIQEKAKIDYLKQMEAAAVFSRRLLMGFIPVKPLQVWQPQ